MLQTYLLTLLAPVVGGGNLLINKQLQNQRFFDKAYTNALKGLACIIVIYVHMAHGYENKVQDMIGSFAYVCVTFFFLVSAYGMMLSVEKKDDYLKSFWRNRLLALLIPCLLINIAGAIFGAIRGAEFNPMALASINSYVVVLLQWCVWFYIVEWAKRLWFPTKTILTDSLLIGGVIVSSLYLYFFIAAEVSAQSGWCFERMGLVWGVLLYRYFDKVVAWMNKHHHIKVAILFVLGGILGVAYLKYKVVYFWGAYLLKIVLGFVLLLLLFTGTCRMKIGCNPFSQWLGDISYEVYLCHGMIMGVLAYYLPQLESGLFVFLTVCSACALSTVVHYAGKPIVNALRKK